MSSTVEQHRFASFTEFYPAYLSEHSHRINRQLHFLGSTLALLSLLLLMVTHQWWWLPAALACGYGFAWVGHVALEKNRPTTFRHPLWSFAADWVMVWQMLTGQLSF